MEVVGESVVSENGGVRTADPVTGAPGVILERADAHVNSGVRIARPPACDVGTSKWVESVQVAHANRRRANSHISYAASGGRTPAIRFGNTNKSIYTGCFIRLQPGPEGRLRWYGVSSARSRSSTLATERCSAPWEFCAAGVQRPAALRAQAQAVPAHQAAGTGPPSTLTWAGAAVSFGVTTVEARPVPRAHVSSCECPSRKKG